MQVIQKHFLLALLPAAVLLGACGKLSAPTSDTTPTVKLTLKAPLGQKTRSQGLRTLGLPGDEAGAPVVNFVKVKVLKEGHQGIVKFNDQNVFDVNGTHEYLVLTPGSNTVQTLLPKGVYHFETIGKVDRTDNGLDDGIFLAYGKNEGVDLWGDNPSVTLDLHTLSDEAMTPFNPRLPVSVVTMNQKLEMRLGVRSPSIGQDNAGFEISFPVPLGDYQVSYSFDDAVGGTLGSSSQLGAKVTTPENLTGDTFRVHADVTGWVQTGPETAAKQGFRKTFEVPFAAPTTIGNDFTPPTVTLDGASNSVNYGWKPYLYGTASDNIEVARVHVYDGSTLIGSSDGSEVVGNVGGVVFDNTGLWWLDIMPQTLEAHDITVIVTDAAGNESRANHTYSGDELFPTLKPTPGYAGEVYFWTFEGSNAWYRLDLSAMSPSHYRFDIFNENFGDPGDPGENGGNPGPGGQRPPYFDVSMHDGLHGLNVPLITPENGGDHFLWRFEGINDANRVYFLHVQGLTGNAGRWGVLEAQDLP